MSDFVEAHRVTIRQRIRERRAAESNLFSLISVIKEEQKLAWALYDIAQADSLEGELARSTLASVYGDEWEEKFVRHEEAA